MSQQLVVACVKSRPAYDHTHVNALFRAVRRNLTVPAKFVCLTDDNGAVFCATRELPKRTKGWWAKLALFQDKYLQQSRVIYLDLDTIILGNIDFLASYEGDFAILRDFYRPDGYGSGIMLWNKPRPDIWTDWIKAGKPTSPLGDQGWIEEKVKDADRIQDLWPGKVASYKADCSWGAAPDCAIVCFHGQPKMEDFPPDHWVQKAWLRS